MQSFIWVHFKDGKGYIILIGKRIVPVKGNSETERDGT